MNKYKDLTGIKIGKLTVVKLSENKFDSNRTTKLWECKCQCGNILYKSARHLNEALKNKKQISCGCSKIRDFTNKKIGDLVVKKFLYADKKNRFWLCECICGEIFIKTTKMLARGKYFCIKKQKENTKYIYRIRNVFYNMKDRCYDKRNKSYKNYGGRGITVCDEWLNSVDSFVEWSLKNGYNENLEIDRIDNDKGYSPENCRWATREEQANNKRTVLKIEYQGKTQGLRKWCRELGLPYRKTHKRLFIYKWDIERCFDIGERVGFI